MKFLDLVKEVKNKDVYMINGNGSKNQFRSITEIKKILKKELKNIDKDSCFLYLGDPVNKKNPDLGYLFQVLHEMRPDILIYMIMMYIRRVIIQKQTSSRSNVNGVRA